MSQLVDIRIPQGEQQGTAQVLAHWLKQAGDPVTADAPLADIETDKVMVELAAPASGVLRDVLKQPGDEVFPGTLIGRIETADTESDTPPATATSEPKDCRHLLSPAVRRLVKTHRIDLARLQGSGRHGRITRQDVLAYLESDPTATRTEAPEPSPLATKAVDAPTNTPSLASRHLPHTPMRRRIAEHMSQSLQTAPHVTSIFEADLSAILRHQKDHRAAYAEQGIKLTLTAYFVLAAAQAMEVEPRINSRFHESSIELYSDINIGIGTALGDEGLIVPVIQKAQQRNLRGIASELQRLTDAARRGTLSPADTQGGTFTLSNHGVSGSLVATPIIINQPQSAILGIGKREKRVVVREVDGDDVIMIRPMAFVSLTIDHRVLDAHQTNRFLARLVDIIETYGKTE